MLLKFLAYDKSVCDPDTELPPAKLPKKSDISQWATLVNLRSCILEGIETPRMLRYARQVVTYNCREVFSEVDKRLSDKPSLGLNELAKQLDCSHPIIQKAVHQCTSDTFREYKHKKLVEKARILFQKGCTAKQIAFELGYSQPGHFYRFIKKTIGLSAQRLKGQKA